MNIIITFLPELVSYQDRLKQLINSKPSESTLIVVTKNRGTLHSSEDNVQIIELDKSLFSRSIFMKIKLARIVLQYIKKDNVIIIDWFLSFSYIFLFKYFKSNICYIYAPVISNYGWLYKRLKNIVPNCGIRYDYLRFRGAIQDFLIVKLCDILIVQSKELMNFYEKVYSINRNKIKYNYNSSKDSPRLEESQKKAKVIIGFIGNLERHKGIKEMKKIFRILLEKNSNIEFHLAGQAKGKENIQIVQSMELFPNVKFIGMLNRDEVHAFYNNIDALILLSYHEGSPRVVREFFQYEKPMFLYDNPGIDYCKGKQGIFVYQYGELQKVIDDLNHVDFYKEYNRELPLFMTEQNLNLILKKIVHDCF